MSVFVRKINKSKWPSQEDLSSKCDEEILPALKADALTSCLRTSNNELSVWVVEDASKDEINKAVLALITNQKLERLDRMHIVYFEGADLEILKIDAQNSPGETIINEYKDLHKNITELNYEKIGKVCTIITSSLRKGLTFSYPERELKNLILNAINSQLIDQKKLHMSLQQKLGLPVLDKNGDQMIKNSDGVFVKQDIF